MADNIGYMLKRKAFTLRMKGIPILGGGREIYTKEWNFDMRVNIRYQKKIDKHKMIMFISYWKPLPLHKDEQTKGHV